MKRLAVLHAGDVLVIALTALLFALALAALASKQWLSSPTPGATPAGQPPSR